MKKKFVVAAEIRLDLEIEVFAEDEHDAAMKIDSIVDSIPEGSYQYTSCDKGTVRHYVHSKECSLANVEQSDDQRKDSLKTENEWRQYHNSDIIRYT